MSIQYSCEEVHDGFLAIPKRKKPFYCVERMYCFFFFHFLVMAVNNIVHVFQLTVTLNRFNCEVASIENLNDIFNRGKIIWIFFLCMKGSRRKSENALHMPCPCIPFSIFLWSLTGNGTGFCVNPFAHVQQGFSLGRFRGFLILKQQLVCV